MALGGLLVANFIFILLLIDFILFILSLLNFIIFIILNKLDKNKKWKKVLKITFGILTIIFLIPLVISHILLSIKQKEIINYNGKKVKINKAIIDDFYVNVGLCDIDEINIYLKKYPELISSKDLQGYGPLGISIKNEQLDCIKYFVEKGLNINEVSPNGDQGTLEFMFYYGYYDSEILDYVLKQDIDVNKCRRAMPVGQLYIKSIIKDREISEEEIEIFKKLLNKGLDLSLTNGSGTDTYTYIMNLSDSIINVDKLKELIK